MNTKKRKSRLQTLKEELAKPLIYKAKPLKKGTTMKNTEKTKGQIINLKDLEVGDIFKVRYPNTESRKDTLFKYTVVDKYEDLIITDDRDSIIPFDKDHIIAYYIGNKTSK